MDALSVDDVAARVALEEIFASGLTDACFHYVPARELELLKEAGGNDAYGDTEVDQVVQIAEELLNRRIGADDAFYDLGSGNGRLCLAFAMVTAAKRSVGVELCPTRHDQAVKAQAAAMQRGLLDGRGSADLLCTSMLDCPLDGASVVFHYQLLAPGGPLLYSLKQHLLLTLSHGACVLMRGQRLPADARGTYAFLRDRTSWAVRLVERGETGGRRVHVCFKRLWPKLKTAIDNRMFQLYGYQLDESQAWLQLSDCDHGNDDQRPLPAPADHETERALAEDPVLVRAVQAWIDAACSEVERVEGDKPRKIRLHERRERLGQSRFERAIYVAPEDDDDDDPSSGMLAIWG